MIALLSPAKSLDYQSEPLITENTQPRFQDDTAELVSVLRRLSATELGDLMSLSEKLTNLNFNRYQDFAPDYTKDNSRQAILAFTGDVYQGLTLEDWNPLEYARAQGCLRILSGLYGVLRPLDLIQPYRLEMGTRLPNSRGKNLYDFWQDRLTKMINEDLKKSGTDLIINLASKEYFSAVQRQGLTGRYLEPVFKDEKNGIYKIISFHAKKARGMMADFIVREQPQHAEDLKNFDTAGYRFQPDASDDSRLVFHRPEA